jgi:hypothetical protein
VRARFYLLLSIAQNKRGSFVRIEAAIKGEVTNRSISFLFNKYSNPASLVMEENLNLQTLQRLLLPVRIIVEEEEVRHIANQAMIQQLSILFKKRVN